MNTRRENGEFLSLISHELKNPATVIMGNASLLLNYHADKLDKDIFGSLSDILDNAQHLLKLITYGFTILKIEQGALPFISEEFELAALIEEALKKNHINASGKSLTLAFNRQKEQLFMVRADRQKTLDVLNCLLDNALAFTQQGTITVSVQPLDKSTKVTVSDTGNGIKPAQQSLLFTKPNKTTMKLLPKATAQSTGLSLYLTTLFVRGMGGDIFLESSSQKGSVFSFTLPTATPVK